MRTLVKGTRSAWVPALGAASPGARNPGPDNPGPDERGLAACGAPLSFQRGGKRNVSGDRTNRRRSPPSIAAIPDAGIS